MASYKVYKSIDRETAFFGIRGGFLYILVMLVAFSLIVAFLVGVPTNIVVGVAVAASLIVVSWYFTKILQRRFRTYKTFERYFFARRLPDRYEAKPKALRNMWRGYNYSHQSKK